MFFPGGLFLHADTVPTSFISFLPSPSSSNSGTVPCFSWTPKKRVGCDVLRVEGRAVFSSLSLSINGSDSDQREVLGQHEKKVEEGVCQEKENVRVKGSGAMNMTKHLWAGAVAAMVSRSTLLNLYRHTSSHTHYNKQLICTIFTTHYFSVYTLGYVWSQILKLYFQGSVLFSCLCTRILLVDCT